MKHGLQLATIFLFVFCAGALVAALDFALIDALGPGPGFFPAALAVIGAALALLLFREVSRLPAAVAGGAVLPDAAGRARTLPVLLFLVAAGVLLEPLGYRLTSLLFIAGLLLVLGVRSPLGVGACALLGSFGVFHVFYHWLKVPLPLGRLGI